MIGDALFSALLVTFVVAGVGIGAFATEALPFPGPQAGAGLGALVGAGLWWLLTRQRDEEAE